MAFRTLSRTPFSSGIASVWRGSRTAFTLPAAYSPRSFAKYPAKQFSGRIPMELAEDDEYHPRDYANQGLQVERTLRHTGHKHWGFVVYRCTYGDDDAWSYFIATLNRQIRESLEYGGTEELMDSLNLSVRDDPSLLDGANKELVRHRFREWRASPEAAAERLGPNSQPVLIEGLGSTPRFNYCIHVDEDALKSVVTRHGNDPPRKGVAETDGYVNLIRADWALPSGQEAEDIRREFDIEDPSDEGYEPIEGVRMRDVGWMKVDLAAVMPAMYAMLHGGEWELRYVRPPQIAA